MIGLIVRHPRIVVILEVDCSAEDGPIPRNHFIQAGRLKGDMMQRGFDDRHCWPPKTFPTFTARLNAALKSSTNCLVVIGARPTRSSISLVFSVEKAPAALKLGAGDEMRLARRLLEQSLRLGESSVDGMSALGHKRTFR
jgi:hypothetical protein